MKSRPRPFQPRPAARPQPSRPRADAEVVFGLRACLAVFDRRRDDVLRVALARSTPREAEELVRWASARRIPLAELPDAELDRIAGKSQHEGICLETRPRKWTPLAELADLLVRTRGLALALDRCRNPYNVGAILRTAAFFGVDAVVLGAPAPHPGLAPNAVRVAEGGAEELRLARTTDLADTLARLRARGAQVVGGDGTSDTSVFGFRFARPAVIVVGHEREGLGERVRAQCDAVVAIPGSGAVESLNVGVAASLLVAEAVRVR